MGDSITMQTAGQGKRGGVSFKTADGQTIGADKVAEHITEQEKANAELAKQVAELKAKQAALEAELASKAAPAVPTGLSVKISVPRAAGTNGPNDKGSAGGGISVYGLQRFPVTMFAGQWERILGETAEAQKLRADILAACKDPRASRKAQ